MNNTCIIIAGPTAAGKTDLSILLAQHFKTDIISADSRQCFKELNIGVAKPSREQLASFPHYFINSHSVTDTVSAAEFETFALNAAAAVFKKNNMVVMAGGTGLYIKAFTEGLDPIPAVDETLRRKLINGYAENGIEWLQEQLRQYDPAFLKSREALNPQRIIRALEVVITTGNPISTFQTKNKKQRPFRTVKLGLEIPRALLYERIDNRVNKMMDAGLLNEVSQLSPYRGLNALQTVGYKELFDHIDGKITLEKAVSLIKQNSRNYAKRQMTWFKKDPDIIWLNASSSRLLSEVLQHIH